MGSRTYASGAIRIVVHGHHDAFDDVRRHAQAGAVSILNRTIQGIATEARAQVPVRSGQLRDSIRQQVPTITPDRVIAEVSADAPHAGYAKWGRKSPGHAAGKVIAEELILDAGSAQADQVVAELADDLVAAVGGE